MHKLGLIERLMFFVNAVFTALLFLSYLIPYVPPKTFPLFSVLSLTVLPLIIINILFFTYWLINNMKRMFLSGIALILGYMLFGNFYQIPSEENEIIQVENRIKVMSYNVRLFNVYAQNKESQIISKIEALIKSEAPDLVFIQEYYDLNGLDFSDFPYQFIHFKERNVANKNGKSKKHILGHAILSKYPLINTEAFDFKDTSNNVITANVIIKKDTLSLYNIHLQSLGILPDVEKLQKEESYKLLKRIGIKFSKQQDQAELVLSHKDKNPYKTIMAGDFNNTQYAYVYKELSKNMQDAFQLKGKGFGHTYKFDFYPLRIDYILANKDFKVLDFKTLGKKLSDHLPIVTTLGWD